MEKRLIYVAAAAAVIALVISGLLLSGSRNPVTATNQSPLNLSALFSKSSVVADDPKGISLFSKVVGTLGSEESDVRKEYLAALSNRSLTVDETFVGKFPKLQELISGADRIHEQNLPNSSGIYATTASRAEFEPLLLALPSKENISTSPRVVVDPDTNTSHTYTEFSFTLVYKDRYYQIGTVYPA